jgi:hypothetical protein
MVRGVYFNMRMINQILENFALALYPPLTDTWFSDKFYEKNPPLWIQNDFNCCSHFTYFNPAFRNPLIRISLSV